jgi:hypothetical protein
LRKPREERRKSDQLPNEIMPGSNIRHKQATALFFLLQSTALFVQGSCGIALMGYGSSKLTIYFEVKVLLTIQIKGILKKVAFSK